MTIHVHEQPLDSRPHRVTVTHGAHGWEVMEHEGDTVVRRSSYTDWHRVERAVLSLEQQANRKLPGRPSL